MPRHVLGPGFQELSDSGEASCHVKVLLHRDCCEDTQAAHAQMPYIERATDVLAISACAPDKWVQELPWISQPQQMSVQEKQETQLFSFPRAAIIIITTNGQTGWPQTTETYSLRVLDPRSPKSRCWPSHAPSKVSGKKALPSFCMLPTILGIPWFTATSFPPLSLSSHGLPCACGCVCPNLSLLRRSLVMGLGTHPNPV